MRVERCSDKSFPAFATTQTLGSAATLNESPKPYARSSDTWMGDLNNSRSTLTFPPYDRSRSMDGKVEFCALSIRIVSVY